MSYIESNSMKPIIEVLIAIALMLLIVRLFTSLFERKQSNHNDTTTKINTTNIKEIGSTTCDSERFSQIIIKVYKAIDRANISERTLQEEISCNIPERVHTMKNRITDVPSRTKRYKSTHPQRSS